MIVSECVCVCVCVCECVCICDDYFLFFFSSRLSECACICVVSWKERCRIIALFNPFSMCDEIKYV